jgi:sugar transferase (PEP-CTERM/EpsH1 system associated)
LVYRRETAAVRALERRAVRQCDAVVLVSPAEAEALGFGGEKILPVANGVDAGFFSPNGAAPHDMGPAGLVFTGTMDYRPNVEAVCWFAEEVYPKLRAARPQLTFTIAGRDPVATVARLGQRPGIRVTGTVQDIRPYLAGAAVAVCPLRIARGIQNKVLEAMAMEKPVVASPAAIEGLEVQVDRHLLQADSPDQWRAAIELLLDDPRRRCEIGRSARQWVLESYTWSARMSPLVKLCLELSGACSDVRRKQPVA